MDMAILLRFPAAQSVNGAPERMEERSSSERFCCIMDVCVLFWS